MLPNSHQRDRAASPSFVITRPRVLPPKNNKFSINLFRVLYINSYVPYILLIRKTLATYIQKILIDQFNLFERMNNRMGRVSAAEFANRNRFRSQKPLPKRGQIKSKIAANAFHSIISVISRASSSGLNSPRKN